eukprot:8327482-Ditylum_brightwellii.AAC.1
MTKDMMNSGKIDEDDQHSTGETSAATPGDPSIKIPGSNMTLYSMWGNFCPHTKGFGDGYPALMGMSQSLGGMIAHCVEVKKD